VSIRSRLVLSTAVGSLAVALTAQAQTPTPLSITGDAERGETLAYTCSGCHGVPGAVNAYPTYHVPKLGGQNADYIEVALQSYRAGLRSHPTMQAQAAELSDQDVADVAAYFASLEGEPATGVYAASGADLEAGKEMSTTCQGCHGADGMAQSPQWPNLAGQHESYLVEALEQYRGGDRKDPVMAAQAAPLDKETLERIAAYYAAQPGLFQTDH
jgi:cytochrome c553